MAPPDPIIFDATSIQCFIRYILDQHAPPSTLVVCSSKRAFLEALQHESESHDGHSAQNQTGPVDEAALARRLLYTPTMRLLSTARALHLTFCPDITHLRAYLATYSISIARRNHPACTVLRVPNARPILALLNPVQLHRHTSAFSAQGFYRTFSTAVEAAHGTGSRLVVTEIPFVTPAHDAEIDATRTPARQKYDIWDEDVFMLNATAKRLGELSSGRTVKINMLASRWFTFQKLPTLDD